MTTPTSNTPSLPACQPIDWQDFLAQHALQQVDPIKRYVIASQNMEVWLKKAQPERNPFLYWLLNRTAGFLNMPWLKASPSARGGHLGISVEVQRLTQLHNANVRVPQVLAQQEGAFLMQDISATQGRAIVLQNAMTDSLHDKQPQSILDLFQIGLQAISELHQKNQYLSQAFARNMVFNENKQLCFIDFEEDPLQVMSLTDCKTRDMFCYLHSTAWPIAQLGVEPQAQALLRQWLKNYPANEQMAFKQAAHHARFARFFPTQSLFGKDVVRIRNLYTLLQAIANP